MTLTQTEQDPRWQSVLTRDTRFDAAFVYAVKTTGIYCRPSCPSRRARPHNVIFYDTPAQAEAAGFRPCQRCDPKGRSRSQAMGAKIAEACRYIEASQTLPTLGELAARAGLSPSHFHRLFRSLTGVTPRQWASDHRARKVRSELIDPKQSVTGAIYEAGFNSGSRFYAQSDEVLGMTPRRFKNGGESANIRFAVGQGRLGAVLVAQSDKGICAITMGDDPDALVRDLQDRFPRANLIGAEAEFETLIAHVVGFVEAPEIGLDLPLDIRGTAFQMRVWQALRQIPSGQTASYAQIAEQLGSPKAVRAVAGACAANKIAVAIPCHRVVRTDGGLSGYRWGVDRKWALLLAELKAAEKRK